MIDENSRIKIFPLLKYKNMDYIKAFGYKCFKYLKNRDISTFKSLGCNSSCFPYINKNDKMEGFKYLSSNDRYNAFEYLETRNLEAFKLIKINHRYKAFKYLDENNIEALKLVQNKNRH